MPLTWQSSGYVLILEEHDVLTSKFIESISKRSSWPWTALLPVKHSQPYVWTYKLAPRHERGDWAGGILRPLKLRPWPIINPFGTYHILKYIEFQFRRYSKWKVVVQRIETITDRVQSLFHATNIWWKLIGELKCPGKENSYPSSNSTIIVH